MPKVTQTKWAQPANRSIKMKQGKIITEAEARALIAADADNLPNVTVSAAGSRAINYWLVDVADNPSQQNSQAWFADAEQAAADAAHGDAIKIEMRSHMTRSRQPECLTLSAEHFDWSVMATTDLAA